MPNGDELANAEFEVRERAYRDFESVFTQLAQAHGCTLTGYYHSPERRLHLPESEDGLKREVIITPNSTGARKTSGGYVESHYVAIAAAVGAGTTYRCYTEKAEITHVSNWPKGLIDAVERAIVKVKAVANKDCVKPK